MPSESQDVEPRPAEEGLPGLPPDRYAALGLTDGGLIVYDRTEPEAWIQSDDAVAIADVSP